MKRNPLLISIFLLPFIISGGGNRSSFDNASRERKKIIAVTKIEPKAIEQISVKNNLIPAMIQVESLGNDSAIGDKHLVGNEAVGALQIRPIMLREVNRILKIQKSNKRYSKKDRYDREKSIEMFMVWKNYHHPDGGFETIARNWNGGPRGYKNKRTEHYWIKIQNELNAK